MDIVTYALLKKKIESGECAGDKARVDGTTLVFEQSTDKIGIAANNGEATTENLGTLRVGEINYKIPESAIQFKDLSNYFIFIPSEQEPSLAIGSNIKVDWGDGIVEELQSSQQHWYEPAYFNLYVKAEVDGIIDSLTINKNVEEFSLDKNNLIDMTNLCKDCLKIKQIPLLDATNTINMSNAFFRCTELVSVRLLNTEKVTDMTSMFNSCYNLRSLNRFDTNNVTTMETMFNDCQYIEHIPSFDVSKVKNMYAMFRDCYALKEAPELNSDVVENIIQLFASCSVLEKVPLLKTDHVTNMTSVFNSCYALKSLPVMNTSNVDNMETMCNGCISLVQVPWLNTSRVQNMYAIFRDCHELVELPEWDVQSANNLSQAFNGCSKLTSLLFKNFNTNFDISTTGLEHDAILTVFDNLMQQDEGITKYLTLGEMKLALMSDEEKLIATNKGWSLS